MAKTHESTVLAPISDERIIEEAAARLQAQYAKENGSHLAFGSFRFLFHKGKFQGVEDWPRHKRYLSPERLEKGKEGKVPDGSSD